ncbi:P2X purinoceptor 7-like, partial [Ruditapes philippinarum]|uniref:P2X purinoceptor 7-like n=1 Tax=Ruditapes philippinarum TaxID=129788 RepID=UPI00295A7AFB
CGKKNESKEIKKLVIQLIKREPGLLFDLLEDDGTPPPQPPHPAASNIPSWCRCLNCREMPTELERKCCGCKPENCVSQRDQMDRICLDPEVLAIGQAYYRDMLGRHRQHMEDYNKTMRHSGYRNFTLWRHGRLGAGVRRVIPSCCVRRIRDTFPSASGTYTGLFQEDMFDSNTTAKIQLENENGDPNFFFRLKCFCYHILTTCKQQKSFVQLVLFDTLQRQFHKNFTPKYD